MLKNRFNRRRYSINILNMLLKFILVLLVHSVLSNNKPYLVQLTEPVDHAEGPHWDSRTGLLYYVDLYNGKLLSYDLVSNDLNSINFNGDLTVAVTSKSDPNLIIVGLNRSVVALSWDGKGRLDNMKILTTVAKNKPGSRFNDGKADKQGRLWFGTMGHQDLQGNVENNQGSLYLITRKNLANPKIMIKTVNISNGLAWNKANNKFYYIDTPTDQVKQYDYDNKSVAISNPKIVFDLKNHENLTGHPDGMTIDEDDNLWIALYDGGAVIKIDPRHNKLLRVIAIPAQYTTSLCWGGPYLDVLFVTTSRYLLNEEDRKKQSAAGSVFALHNLGTRGLPAYTADIVDSI